MVTNKLFRNIARKTAPYLAAITMALPFSSCYSDRNRPSPLPLEVTAQEEYSPQEHAEAEQAQVWYQEASKDSVISQEELNDLETRVDYKQNNPEKQKAVSLTSLASEEIPDCDLDQNGKTDIFDLLYLLRILSGSTPDPEKKADLNKDGKTDIFDLLTQLQVLSGTYGSYKVCGKVKGIHAGNPEYSTVPNATVTFKDKDWNPVVSVKSDANGNYSAYLKEGDYFMCVSADDYWDYPHPNTPNNPFVKGNGVVSNKNFYFEIEGLNSGLNKDGILLNKDIDYPYFEKVLKHGSDTNPDGGLPVAKPEKNPKTWVQENTNQSEYWDFSKAKPAAENVAISDIPNFQREFTPVLTDSSNAKFRSFFVPDGHPMLPQGAWARYITEVDWNTNTVTGGTIWYFNGLIDGNHSKGVYREEKSQVMMNMSDIFTSPYQHRTLYYNWKNGNENDFTQLDKDNIGTIYHLVPKGL